MPNPLGSSYGKARITRLGTAEGKEYIPYAKFSQEIVEQLQQKTNEKLHIGSHGLIIGPNDEKAWPQLSANYARDNNISCEIKDKTALDNNYEIFNIQEAEAAYCEPSMGMFIPDKCQNTLIQLAKEQKVEFIFEEAYTGFDSDNATGSMQVHTDKKTYATDLS